MISRPLLTWLMAQRWPAWTSLWRWPRAINSCFSDKIMYIILKFIPIWDLKIKIFSLKKINIEYAFGYNHEGKFVYDQLSTYTLKVLSYTCKWTRVEAGSINLKWYLSSCQFFDILKGIQITSCFSIFTIKPPLFELPILNNLCFFCRHCCTWVYILYRVTAVWDVWFGYSIQLVHWHFFFTHFNYYLSHACYIFSDAIIHIEMKFVWWINDP